MSIGVAHPRVGVLPYAPTASHTSIGDVGEGLFDGIIGGRLGGGWGRTFAEFNDYT